jgi:hypothetical protein
MSNIGFKRLSRGVKLLTGHIQAQIQKALDRFTRDGVSANNLDAKKGRVRISFSWSDLKPGVGPGTPNHKGHVQAMFSLPPPQNMFRDLVTPNPKDVNYVLDGVTLGFDQRAEAAAITATGGLDFGAAANLTLPVTILSKHPVSSGGQTTNCIAQIEFNSLNFSNTHLHTNPVIRSGLGILVDPYKTLILQVDLSKLQDSSAALSLSSMVVSLDFYADLMERDRAVDSAGVVTDWKLQNVPTSHKGFRATDPKTIIVPAAGSVITADSAAFGAGVQSSIEAIDSPFHDGLVGGYGDKSAPNGFSNILTDAGYEVIAVPMWGNGWDGIVSGVGSGDIGNLPFVGPAPFSLPTCDRRVIPLQFPIVVHHVLAAAHYDGLYPSTPGFEVEIGVGLGCGIRADLFQSRQLAHAKWTTANETDYEIDSFDDVSKAKLYSIPLVHNVGQEGVGYPARIPSLVETGTPVFCGQSLSSEVHRTDMAASVGAAAATPMPLMHGKEQFLEVRWSFNDPAGLANMLPGEGPVGFGGHWVYIIGKKHLC